MRKIQLWIIIITIISAASWWFNPSILYDLGFIEDDDNKIIRAWQQKRSNIHVQFQGRVVLLLPDQIDYGTTQEFLVILDSGHRLKVAHDLDVSARVPVKLNDVVRVKGEYDWNETGGVVHWTHKDASNEREGGWIELNYKRYQ